MARVSVLVADQKKSGLWGPDWGFKMKGNSFLIKRVTLTSTQYKFFFHRFLRFLRLVITELILLISINSGDNHRASRFGSKMAVNMESHFTFV